ncbi:MAG TPA: quinone-dependent dihydroorotate dehydrogenase [Gillisia sp.]|nr:quinone-dependent dihydroorotate dehydrogenase [Gillisia sp.]
MIRFLYKSLLKPILFNFDPEKVHDVFVDIGELLGKSRLGREIISLMYKYKGPDITTTVDGISYKYPIVLAAGFDYNGRLAGVLDCLSFGGDEIGSVTARPCSGNPKPRLTRLIKSKSLVVYKGLKNEGVDKIIARLKTVKNPSGFIRGISIAKTNDAANISPGAGLDDYFYSFKKLTEENIGDFYTINISCPNVHGGENFAEPERLDALLKKLFSITPGRPVYCKMPINISWEDFNELLKILDSYPVNGVVIGNLNKDYSNITHPEDAPREYRGGLSGAPCFELSNELIRRTRRGWGKRFTIIGCGGILSAEDAMEKFEAGADLLQLITGMIFEGPHLMKEICEAYSTSEFFRKKRSWKMTETEVEA